jgi:hypothetical protein
VAEDRHQAQFYMVDSILRQFAVPKLTRKRIWFAFAVAAITDAVQFSLGPVGWFFVDEGLDTVAMVLTAAALGFHVLLLPTFILEMIPGPDMLPTWTACTAAVVVRRKKAQSATSPMIAAPPRIIDVAPPRPAEIPGEKVKDPP